MAITFGFHRKKEKRLIIIVIIALTIGGIIIGVGLKEKPLSLLLEVPKPIEPKINWGVLIDSRMEKLQSLEEIPPLSGEAGRENPFLPY